MCAALAQFAAGSIAPHVAPSRAARNFRADIDTLGVERGGGALLPRGFLLLRMTDRLVANGRIALLS